jgi:transcriptional regulator with XRE-family HTH domain
MILREIGDRLRFVRKNRTQKEFASQYGIPQGTLSKFECGKLEPGIAFLTEVSKREGVSINWILTGEADDKTKRWTLREPSTEYHALSTSAQKILNNIVEILESGNEAIIEALKANIEVYLETIRIGKKGNRDKGRVK